MYRLFRYATQNIGIFTKTTVSLLCCVAFACLQSTAAVTLQCPDGWSLYGGSCYVYVPTPLPWQLAKDVCKSNGGYLTQPIGYDQITYLGGISTNSFWIGFNSIELNGDVMSEGAWSDGTPVGTEVGSWGYNQPDVSRGRCVRLSPRGSQLLWYYDSCKIALTYFCELKPCPTESYRCWSSGQCLAASEAPNDRVDCQDGSDETDHPAKCFNIVTLSTPNFASPNFHQPYDPLTNCQWTIIGSVGSRVHINFTSFNTEKDFDEVYIWTGGRTVSESRFLTKLSGGMGDVARTYWSSNNFLILQFVSDNDTQARGFSVVWGEASVGASPMKLDAGDQWRELTSPLYTSHHVPGGIWATWTITTQSDRLISIQIREVSLSHRESVVIYDGPDVHSPILTYLTDDLVSTYVYSTKRTILIQMIANQKSPNNRFKLSYKQGCNVDVKGDNGIILSPGYSTMSYPGMLNCRWLVYNTRQRLYTMKLTYNIETDKDFIKIYEQSPRFRQIHPGSGYTGTSTETVVQTASSQVTIEFLTSAINAVSGHTGFKVIYSVGCEPLSINTVTTVTRPAVFGSNYGDKVELECRPGYRFVDSHVGARTLECRDRGEWSEALPLCQTLSCGRIPMVANGYVVSSSGIYPGSEVKYVCFSGFVMTGSDVINCSSGGEWGQPPICTATSCRPQPTITSGRLSYVNKPSSVALHYSTMVAFSCNENYELSGFSSVVCLKNGSWSHDFPTCQRRLCWVPDDPHGSYTPTVRYYGDTVTVSCDSGYQPKSGVTFSRCGHETAATCEDINECNTNNGACSQTCSNTDGSFLCSCYHGYTVNARSPSACDDVDECKQSSHCSHGCVNAPGTYTCTCPSGQQLFDPVTHDNLLPAGENGLDPWNVYYANHTCISVTCGVSKPSSALVILTSQQRYRYGDTIEYMCSLGYVMQGVARLTCQQDGQWNAATPTCTAAMCQPTSLAGLKYPPVKVTPGEMVPYGGVVNYECRQTQTVVTKSQRCVYDVTSRSYRMMGPSLECSVTDCGLPQHISGSQSANPTCTYEGCSFVFQCLPSLWVIDGQSAAGKDTTVRCQGSNALWDFGTLRCLGLNHTTPPSCPDPGRPPDGVQISDSYWEGGLAYFGCLKPGYIPDTSFPIQCVYDPTSTPIPLAWNGSVPQCVDTQKPTFINCPRQSFTIPLYSSTSIAVPIAVDNSGLVTRLYTEPLNYDLSEKATGPIDIKYHAVDANGNRAHCTVYIRIKDELPPQLTCPKSKNIELPSSMSTRYFDAASESKSSVNATDNSGQVDIIYEPSTLTVTSDDVGQIKYIDVIARDPSGNEDRCKLQVSITARACQAWSLKVERARVSCVTKGDKSGLTCRIRCNVGTVFFEDAALQEVVVSCTNGVQGWNRALPQCVSRHYPSYVQIYEFSYRTTRTDCSDLFKQKFEEKFRQVMATLSTGDCSTPMHLREATQDWVQIAIHADKVVMTVSVVIGNIGHVNASYTKCASIVLDEISNQRASIDPIKRLVTDPFCDIEPVTYDGVKVNEFRCIGNLELRKEASTSRLYCVQCPAGYYGVDKKSCLPCQPGTYQTTRNSNNCQTCPTYTRSKTTAATTRDQCSILGIAYCAKGMASPSGLAPCDSCPINTYAEDTTKCTPCPLGKYTTGHGKFSINDCIFPCQAGQYSTTGLEPCSKCPRNTYQWGTRQTHCIDCHETTETQTIGSSRQADCKPVSPCSVGECQNGGTCEIHNHKHYCRCAPGYTGSICDVLVNPCQSQPCYNQGTCKQNGLSYTCQCPLDTSGSRCETTLFCKSHNCRDGSRCHSNATGFSCVCPVDKMIGGFLCGIQLTACDPRTTKCISRSTCLPQGDVREMCQCNSGFYGPKCDQTKDSCQNNPCLNGGTCQRSGPGYTCSCPSGYSGTVCEQRISACTSSTCGPQAVCIDMYHNSTVICKCLPGFYKENGACVQKDFCLTTQCHHGGTCVSDGGSYKCQCVSGYEGSLCQHNIDDCATNPCLNGALCIDEIAGFRCNCVHPDTSGTLCSDIIDDCDPLPCDMSGMASCINHLGRYECICRPGYTGPMCAESIDDCLSSPCRHGSQCTDLVNDYRCVCRPGWTGKDCDTALTACTSQSCNRGNCLDAVDQVVCRCETGYLGDRCDIRYDVCQAASHCTGPGSRCVATNTTHPSCVCPTGYTGESCDIRIDACHKLSCLNGGTCVASATSVTCSCVKGYTGNRCGTDIDECASITCPGNAVCQDTVGDYRCICPPGKAGVSCSKDINYNVDLLMMSSHRIITPWSVRVKHRTALTVAWWMRTDVVGSHGTSLTLFMAPKNQSDIFRRVLFFDHAGLHLDLASRDTRTVAATGLMDGAWHHVTVTWTSHTGDATLYVDRQVVGVTRAHARGSLLPSFASVGLGALFINAAGEIVQGTQFSGRLSRVVVITSPDLVTSSLSVDVLAGKNQINSEIYNNLFVHSSIIKDYDSELASSTQCPCPTIKNTNQTSPRVSSCSTNQMVVSTTRSTLPNLQEPTFENTIATTIQPDPGVALGWGTHYITYVGSDAEGRSVICTIRYVVRRSVCRDPQMGSSQGKQSCTGNVCTVECSGFRTMASPPTAKSYSCSKHNMWGSGERMTQFRYPGCAAVRDTKKNIDLRVKVDTRGSCSVVKDTYESEIRRQIVALNNAWNKGLCQSNTCSDVTVSLACDSAGQGTVTMSFTSLSNYLVKTNSPQTLQSPSNILREVVFDNSAFSSPQVRVEASTLRVDETATCDPGSELVSGSKCVECGVGYRDTGSGICEACPIGSYQPNTGQTSCLSCFGQTTSSVGAQSKQDCKMSCHRGSAYSTTTGNCESCPIGFYQTGTGQFSCLPCPVNTTTAGVGSSSLDACLQNGDGGQGGDPNSGESLGATTGQTGGLSTGVIIALVIIFFVIAAVIFLIIGCCCRDRLIICCPCTETGKVAPEKMQDWQYIHRFGESNEKHIIYKVGDSQKPPSSAPVVMPTLKFEADTEKLVKPEVVERLTAAPHSGALSAEVTASPKRGRKHRTEEERLERRRRRHERRERRRQRMEAEVANPEENVVELDVDEADTGRDSPRLRVYSDRIPKPLPLVPAPTVPHTDVENTTSFAYWRNSLKGRPPNSNPKVSVEVATVSNGYLPSYHVEAPKVPPVKKIFVDSDEENR